MDDCTLEKLSVKPAKLSPAFKKDVVEYASTVSSDVSKVTVDCMTSDTGASYQIKGNQGSKAVELAEGKITAIDIEVTSEDGTVGHYIININRLSAKDASLQSLSVDKGALSPAFDSQTDEYSGIMYHATSSRGFQPQRLINVPLEETEVMVTATAPDAKCQLTVDGKIPGEKTILNIGETQINVVVGSIDGSTTKTYRVSVVRPQVPRYIRLADKKLRMKFEDCFTLSPYYLPTKVRESDPVNIYSAPIIAELTKTNKTDPLSQLPLPSEWEIRAYDVDKELSSSVACIPKSYGGCTAECPVRVLPKNLKEVNTTPKPIEPGAECQSVSVKHTYEMKSWEKSLHQIFDETNASTLLNQSKESVKRYLAILPDKPSAEKSYEKEQAPLDYLHHAACCVACAVKSKKTDAASHLQLGLVLEERYLAEDLYALKKEGDHGSELASLNLQVKAGSKEEEIQAICKLHGVDEKAPLSLVLKALDTEYQAMKNAGQTAKAEQVQSLFAWKNKQATQEGAAAQKASDDNNPLGQAYLKYLDALSCDESKAVYHFHVGRLQVIQAQYDDAVVRLQSALSWNKQHQMSRFYLGLALSLRPGGAGSRSAEAFGYIQEAMELLLSQLTNQALGVEKPQEKGMLVENLLRITNVHILRGIISLGKMIQSNPELGKDCMSSEDLFHTAVLLACIALPTVSRGDLYKQLEWVILEGHSLLLDLMLTRGDDPQYIVKRCQGLSAMIRCCTIEKNMELTSLQVKTCQSLVKIQQASSQALYLLGDSQLALYDLDPQAENAVGLLNDCKSSLRASINLEGKSTHSPLPDELKEQKWWKEEEAKKAGKPAQSAPAASSASASKAGNAPAAGRGGATAARGRGAAIPAAASKAPSKTQTAPAKPAAKAAPAKPAAGGKPAAVGRGAAAPSGRGAPAKQATTLAAAAKSSEKPTAAEAQKEDTKPASDNSKPSQALPEMMNRKSHHARLCLARALSRTDDGVEEAKKLYEEVMTMAPEVHDAYIELAELLSKIDPLAAVDVYCKFPIPENPGFDDAYIFGEIVLLLFKHEKYDHPKLPENMIRLGQIMGLAYLDKYVKKLEEKYKNDLLMQVYAGINRKPVDDPDMVQFFKFKYWM